MTTSTRPSIKPQKGKNMTMPTLRTLVATLFFMGIALLGWFLTPFFLRDTGEIVHARITSQGGLLIGRFLLYIVILTAVCIGVALIGLKNKAQ